MRHGVFGGWNQVWQRCTSLLLLAAASALAPLVQAADDALLMGVFPRRNFAETAKFFTPMADYLAERLGRKVTLVTARNFETFGQALSEKRYDIVHYNAYHYIRSAQNYEV